MARQMRECLRGEMLNYHNAAKRMTEIFGYSNIFATLSLSLSLSLSQLLTVSSLFLDFAGVRAPIYGFSCELTREAVLLFSPLRTFLQGDYS